MKDTIKMSKTFEIPSSGFIKSILKTLSELIIFFKIINRI